MPRSSAKSRSDKAAQVAQHGRLGVVLGEDGVAQDRARAAAAARGWRHVRLPLGTAGRRPGEPGAEGRQHGLRRGPRSSSRCTRRRRGRRRPGAAARPGRRRRPRSSAPGREPAPPDVSKNCRWTSVRPAALEPASPAAAVRAVHPPGDAAQALGPVVHGVHRGRRPPAAPAPCRCSTSPSPADVLLARLQRQAVGRPALGVDREPDQAARQVPLEAGLDGHEGGVRARRTRAARRSAGTSRPRRRPPTPRAA